MGLNVPERLGSLRRFNLLAWLPTLRRTRRPPAVLAAPKMMHHNEVIRFRDSGGGANFDLLVLGH